MQTVTDPDRLLRKITDKTAALGDRVDLIATNRQGDFDGAFRRDRRTDRYVRLSTAGFGGLDDVEELAELVREYAQHPDRDQMRVRTNERFPQSVELYLG